MKYILSIFAVLQLCVPATASDYGPITIKSPTLSDVVKNDGSSYIYFDSQKSSNIASFNLMLIRVLSEAEKEDYLAQKKAADGKSFQLKGLRNVYEIKPSGDFDKKSKTNSHIAPLPPGEYVIFATGRYATIFNCYCMGTVKFTVKPETVVDLGTLLVSPIDNNSPFKELAPYSIPEGEYHPVSLIGMAIRPRTPNGKYPENMTALKIQPAEFQAVGKMPNYLSFYITRLAPVPGILEYDEDRVIDGKTGEEIK